MKKGKLVGTARREAQQRSREPRKGGVTMYGAQAMAEGLSGTPAACTVTGYYRTSIFEYPASYSGKEVAHTVYSADGVTAAIVSDLPRYFERSGSLHYSIDVSVGFRANEVHRIALEQANDRRNTTVPLFLVVEEFVATPATALSSSQCYSIEEVKDGQQVIEGGRNGKVTLLAIQTAGGPWPETAADPNAINPINAVLVAVKSELDAIDHIVELCSVDCFVTDDGRAVYPIVPTMSGTLRATQRVNSTDVAKGADRIGAMLEAMMSDSEQVVPELLDSLVIGESQNDEYLRLWYLRLWEALKEAKAHLGGGPTTGLTEHRNAIAHWRTAKIDYARLRQLQLTTMELLRRKYP